MDRKSAIFNLVFVILAYFIIWQLVPRATFIPIAMKFIDSVIPLTNGTGSFMLGLLGSIIASSVVVLFMLIQLGIVYYFSHIRMSFIRNVVVLIVLLTGIIGVMVLIVFQSGVPAKMHHFPNLKQILYIVGVYPSAWKMPMYTLIILASACIGYMVSMRIKDKNLLLPVAMFAAYIDFWTVTKGPVSSMLKKAPELVNAVAAPIPHAGTGAFIPVTMIGPGDFLFAGLVFASIHRLKLNDTKNFWFVFAAMTIGMLAVMAGVLQYLPALIMLAIAVVFANWKEFKLTKQEIISVIIVGLLLLASLPLVWSLVVPNEKPAAKHAPANTTMSK